MSHHGHRGSSHTGLLLVLIVAAVGLLIWTIRAVWKWARLHFPQTRPSLPPSTVKTAGYDGQQRLDPSD
jgi:hypothetical protein